MAGADSCSVTNAVANDYANSVTAVNRKYNALQRLSELLEQLGDAQDLLEGVNPTALVPLYLINFDTYTNLVTACPFLNLPSTPSNDSVAELQEKVTTAYANMIKRLNLSPFIRMSNLQSQMDKTASNANKSLNNGTQYMQCLQQACATSATVENFVNNFQQEADQFAKNYLTTNGQILTQQQQQKVSVIRGLIDNLNELMTTAPVTSPSIAPVIPQVPIPYGYQIPPPPTSPLLP